MITSKFYSQMYVCPKCHGVGRSGVDRDESKNICKECMGAGVFLVQSDKIYYWGKPSFVDYQKRTLVKITRTVAAILVFVLLVLVSIMIRKLISSIFVSSLI